MTEALKRILYVEDDEDIAEVAEMTLVDFGEFDVKHCPSGPHALKVFTDYRPQLVLMDVMMPEMDGPETLRQLRQMPGGHKTPVIFMTAKAQLHEQEAYRKMGSIGVIVKPFEPLTLCSEIRRLWEEQNG